MAMRLSGLMSGMDTESVIQQLVEARSAKVTTAKNDQTKLEWKQEIWKGLNSKLRSLQSKLNDLRFTGGYVKKTTSVSDSSVANVLTSGEAVNSVQDLQVNRLAKTAYLTGGRVSMKAGFSGGVSALTRMDFLMDFSGGSSKTITLGKSDGSQADIELKASDTISDVLTRLKDAGVNASFDATQKRFFINAKDTGEKGDFNFTGDATALKALGLDIGRAGSAIQKEGLVTEQTTLSSLGINAGDKLTWTVGGETKEITMDSAGERIEDLLGYLNKNGVNATYDERQKRFYVENDEVEFGGAIAEKLGLDSLPQEAASATMIHGQDAMITLNGAAFESENNVFEINGLTITALSQTDPGKSITLTTKQDTDGIYDMIKDFFKSYNEVINEMDKLYGADSAKGYEPLSDDEKSSMSESEVEKYEKKIKDSLLRRDSSLNSVSSAMKRVMMDGATVNGKKMYLVNFGIETMNYFLASDGERNAYHINGDPDDVSTSAEEDELKKMIETDPDTVISFFSQLTMNLYNEMNNQSKSVEGYRSFGNFYDDKKMKSDYDDYTAKIKDLEKKLADYEDKWYKKFAAMETTMAKMQSNANSLTSMLGGS